MLRADTSLEQWKKWLYKGQRKEIINDIRIRIPDAEALKVKLADAEKHIRCERQRAGLAEDKLRKITRHTVLQLAACSKAARGLVTRSGVTHKSPFWSLALYDVLEIRAKYESAAKDLAKARCSIRNWESKYARVRKALDPAGVTREPPAGKRFPPDVRHKDTLSLAELAIDCGQREACTKSARKKRVAGQPLEFDRVTGKWRLKSERNEK